MEENLVTGKKFRILTDKVNDIWDRVSFWKKASDIVFDDEETLENKKTTFGLALLKRRKAYKLNDIAYIGSAPSWVMLVCTTAGTTASSEPTSRYQAINTPGQIVQDGTANFTVYDVRPQNTNSNSAYTIPSMKLVNNIRQQLTTTVDGSNKLFYFDYQNGKFGFNTSSNRSASTFIPFKGE